jgi:hypothetical protein
MGVMLRRWALVLPLCLTAGCASMMDSLVDSLFDSGESEQQRADRKKMDTYRQTWSTPGRRPHEVEIEARGTFKRVHGREPDVDQPMRRGCP